MQHINQYPPTMSICLILPEVSAGPELPALLLAKPVTTIQWLVTCCRSLRLATPFTFSSNGALVSKVTSKRSQFTSVDSFSCTRPEVPLLLIADLMASAHLTCSAQWIWAKDIVSWSIQEVTCFTEVKIEFKDIPFQTRCQRQQYRDGLQS